MPPRIRLPSRSPLSQRQSTQYICRQCRHASVVATPAAPVEPIPDSPLSRYPPTQPPSHRRPEFRKTQLHRQYQSTLRSSPLIILFQHNNLKAVEWMGIRRELAQSLRAVDDELAKSGHNERLGESIKIQTIQTGIFSSALKVVEFWNPNFDITQETPAQPASAEALKETLKDENTRPLNHGLSEQAWRESRKASKGKKEGIDALLSGPVAVLSFPSVSPQYVKAALSILSPSPDFPAPKRKARPSYHEPSVQNGLQKLMMLGARVDGKMFDFEGVRWIGGIQGGLDGLRAQLVAMLSGVGAGITNALEAASRNLYFTMESRKSMLEEESGKGKEDAKKHA